MGACAGGTDPEKHKKHHSHSHTKHHHEHHEKAIDHDHEDHKHLSHIQEYMEKNKYKGKKPMTEKELEVLLNEYFDKFDKNQDGELNAEEIADMLTHIYSKHGKLHKVTLDEVEDFMQKVDKDRELTIDKKEFYKFYKHL